MEATISKAEYDAAIAEKQGQINALRHELEQLKRLIFGRSSERSAASVPAEQMALWDEGAHAGYGPGAARGAGQADKSEEITYSRRKPKTHPGRAKLPDHLPVEEIVLEPEANTEGLECIGEEVTDTLDYRPGKLVIIRRRRPKYARPEANGSTTVLVAELPRRPIDRGIPEPGLLAELCVAKYVDHLPFYRQVKRKWRRTSR